MQETQPGNRRAPNHTAEPGESAWLATEMSEAWGTRLSTRDRLDPPDREAPARARAGRVQLWALRMASVAMTFVLLVGFGQTSLTFTGGTVVPPFSDPSAASAVCNPVQTRTPSAMLIPLDGPAGSLGSGGRISATFELGTVNYTAGNYGQTVYVPSLAATFPLAGGDRFSLYFPPSSATISGSGWMTSSFTTVSGQTSTGLSFASGGSAVLSSQKLAVMASTAYGVLTLEVRWYWTLTSSSGGVDSGSWSTPTSQSDWPIAEPSIFYPAPYVSVLGTSGSTVTIGTNFTAQLGGMLSGRYVFLEIEYPNNGTVVQAHGQTAPVGATTFLAQIVFLNYDHSMSPGAFLVHIHDGCGAMLHSISEIAEYASSAKVTFGIQPGSCGSIKFNGGSYSTGTSTTVKPSTIAYNFSLPSCSGHTFSSWGCTGGLHLASAGRLLVSSSGTFQVQYK